MRTRLTAALLVLLMPWAALADFKRDYGTGLKALQDGDLDRAVSDFEKAIAENPDSAERVRIYGMRFEPYLPHYYLGEARFRSGDCAGALSAWEEAERRGVIQGQGGYSDLEANRASCSRTLLDPAQLAAAQQAVADLRKTVAQMNDLKDEMGRDFQGAWESTLSAARQRLTEYENQLAAAEAASDAGAVDTVAASAQGENANLQALWTEASQRLTALNRQRQAERAAQQRSRARADLAQALAAARSELAAPAADPSLQAMAGELQNLAEQGENLPASSNLGTIQNLTRSITGRLREYRQASQNQRNQQLEIARRTPPDELRQLAELYFSGEYGELVRRANPSSFGDDRARLQALLFRASARFNTYTLGGENDAQLLRQAQNDIRSIKRIRGDFTPYLAAFSPKFLTLFESTR